MEYFIGSYISYKAYTYQNTKIFNPMLYQQLESVTAGTHFPM